METNNQEPAQTIQKPSVTQVTQEPVKTQTQDCKYCGQSVASDYYFCPYCGKRLINPPITLLREIGLYLFSILLPPLGLWPAIKYLMQKDTKAKRVGTIAIILTIIASIITIWISVISFNGIMKTVSTQLNSTPDLQQMGY